MNMTDGLRQILICAVFGVSLLFLAYFLSNKLYKYLKKKEDKRREFVDNYFEELLKKRKPHLEDEDEEDKLISESLGISMEAYRKYKDLKSESVEAVGTNAGNSIKDATNPQEEQKNE
jgi:hypothetical protein